MCSRMSGVMRSPGATIGIPGGIELLLGIDPESGSLSARSKEEWGSTESVLWFLREVPPETAENP